MALIRPFVVHQLSVVVVGCARQVRLVPEQVSGAGQSPVRCGSAVGGWAPGAVLEVHHLLHSQADLTRT